MADKGATRGARLNDGSLRFLLGSVDGLVSYLSDGLAEFFRLDRCRVSLVLDIDNHGCFICGSRTLLRQHDVIMNWLASNHGQMPPLPRDNTFGSPLFQHYNRQQSPQGWFVEAPRNLCANGPVNQWLIIAAEAVAHSVSSCLHGYELSRKNPPPVREWAVGPSNYDANRRQLAGFATEAVSEYIREEFLDGLKSLDAGQYLAPPTFLHSVLRISTMLEEGALAYGTICLYIGDKLDDLPFVARFDRGTEPALARTKHVRKLLTSVSDARFALVTDGDFIYGILGTVPDDVWLLARFRGRTGEIVFRGQTVCTFSAGRYFGTYFAPTMESFVQALARSGLDISQDLVAYVRAIVDASVQGRHGCTIVIDCRSHPPALSGQKLAVPLEITRPDGLALTCSMAKVDGAIHFHRDGTVLAFGCLLDGSQCQNEDLARGARYNSALRFSATCDQVAVIVASEDGWRSVFANGEDVLQNPTAKEEDEATLAPPPGLDAWLRDSSSLAGT